MVGNGGWLVVQKERLETRWPETFVQPEVIKSHILDIRAALEDRPKNPRFIETLPRRGYRFIAPVSDVPTESTISLEPASAKLVGRTAEWDRRSDSRPMAVRGRRQML